MRKAGIFVATGGAWHLAGPPLGSRPEGGPRSSAYCPSNGGLAALLGLASGAPARAGARHYAVSRRPWSLHGPTPRDMAHICPTRPGPGRPLGLFRGHADRWGLRPDRRPRWQEGTGRRPRARPRSQEAKRGAGWRRLPAPPQARLPLLTCPEVQLTRWPVSKTVLTVWALVSGLGELGQGPGARRAGPVRVVELMTDAVPLPEYRRHIGR